MSRHLEERPDPVELLRGLSGDGHRRGMLRVYLGYAPGTGTTTAMLDEARRRHSRGTDVVVGAYRLHDDPARALEGLEVIGAGRPRPSELALDPEAVLARNPDVVCVDDLAATDKGGRPVVEAVPPLLAAGIVVLATLHVLSLRQTASVTGLEPDGRGSPLLDESILEVIGELEIVDVPPEDLLARIRDRGVLKPAELAVAMQRELRPQVMRLLRETGLRMIADHADRQLAAYLPETQPPLEFRGRIVVCVPVAAGMEDRIRGAARHAARQDAKFTVVTVRTRSLSDEERTVLGQYATLAHQLGGEFVRLEGRRVAPTIARYLTESKATEVILGHRRRSRWVPWDTTSELIRRLNGIDVHILRATAYGRRPTPK